MAKHKSDPRFSSGEVGVDGAPTEQPEDPADRERAAAIEGLARNRAYLGREFLTWVLWASNAGKPLCEYEGAPVTVLLVGKVVLRGLAGEATELAVKGHQSAYAPVVRFAIDRGLLIHVARLRMQWGERLYEATIDAEFLDIKSATVPVVESAAREDDEGAENRLEVCEHIGHLVEALWSSFMAVRTRPEWKRKTVPAMKAWLGEPVANV